jgi:hypothetical protein
MDTISSLFKVVLHSIWFLNIVASEALSHARFRILMFLNWRVTPTLRWAWFISTVLLGRTTYWLCCAVLGNVALNEPISDRVIIFINIPPLSWLSVVTIITLYSCYRCHTVLLPPSARKEVIPLSPTSITTVTNHCHHCHHKGLCTLKWQNANTLKNIYIEWGS